MHAGTIKRVYRGLYARQQYWDSLNPHDQIRHIVRSLAQQHPDWVFCGPTAAIMHGLDCSYRFLLPICIVAKPGTHIRNTAQLAHHAMAYPETAVIDGVPVTVPLRTLFDCAAKLPLRFSLSILDSALRKQVVQRPVLEAYPHTVKYVRNRKAALRAFSLADARSENGGESEARGVLTEIGYPVHDLQTVFPCLTYSSRNHRVDFLWVREDGTKIAGEFDGVRKYVDPEMTSRRDIRAVVTQEREREHCLERQNVDVVRMFYDELNRPNQLVAKLRAKRVPHA
ncbi:CTP synthase [Bifidobacterium felsineum]|uniref:CTP synthase n=1 Tax=Bifidobacterium felsineum TaxID=2045440 RepID=A0A2M9HIG1_9BIFI|nr:CTP synthase [Bifidobacterium felsineum]PJM76604.1 CTP synthase [Bifidobacterium felsineum]